MVGGIYVLISPSGKRYVGQTKDFKVRFSQHSRDKRARHLATAINKYGWNGFKKEILVITDDTQLKNEVEKELIAKWNLMNRDFGYNMTSGGDVFTMSEEVKCKIRHANSQRVFTEEQLERLRTLNIGRKLSNETKIKIGNAGRGKKRTSTTKLLIAKAMSNNKRGLSKDLYAVCDLNGVIIKEDTLYNLAYEYALAHNISINSARCAIHNVVAGYRASTYNIVYRKIG